MTEKSKEVLYAEKMQFKKDIVNTIRKEYLVKLKIENDVILDILQENNMITPSDFRKRMNERIKKVNKEIIELSKKEK